MIFENKKVSFFVCFYAVRVPTN